MNNIEILEEFIEDYVHGDFVIQDRIMRAIENLIKENKELKEHLQKYYDGKVYTAKQLKNIEENQKKYFINKQILKEIIYPTPENYIPFKVQTSEMYKKLESLLED